MKLWLALWMACAAFVTSGCTSTPVRCTAQDTRTFLPALPGDYFPIHSKFTQRNYHIFVRLPEGYDAKSGKRYPVIYLLDGDILFPLLASQHLLLHYDEKIPEAIIVGIAYGTFGLGNFRSTDYTIRLDDSPPEYGGGAPISRIHA